jgi:hypothetical protein
MGFQRGRVILEWPEKHELHGLEVVMRRQPFGDFMDNWLADLGGVAASDELPMKERAARMQRNADTFVELIVSWNLEDEGGEPVMLPPRIDGDAERDMERARVVHRHCDTAMLGAMRDAYESATTRVPPPLPENSGPGSPPAVSTAPEMPEEWAMPGAQEVLAPAG